MNPYDLPYTTRTGQTALLVVDFQGAFLPRGGQFVIDGGLAVQLGWDALPTILRYADDVDVVVASHDMHPPQGHVAEMRADNPGGWPDHGRADTPEAEIDARVLARADFVVSKGFIYEPDQYSPFEGLCFQSGKPLERELRERGVTRLIIVGIATDYCVRAAVLDALRLGFEVQLAVEGCAGVDVNPGDSERAIEEMVAAGATLTSVEAEDKRG